MSRVLKLFVHLNARPPDLIVEPKMSGALTANNTALSKAGALLLLFLLFGGCATVSRSKHSGYSGSNTESSRTPDFKSERLDAVAIAMGFDDPSTLSSDQLAAVRTRDELIRTEHALEGRRERDQYFHNKPYMRSDRDRLAFLELETFEERNRWLEARKISGSATPHSPQAQAIIDQNDIAIGMTKQAVRDSWGEPESVDVAGNPLYGNERWLYKEQTTSTDGYRTEKRLVYFEAGRVAGWDKQKDSNGQGQGRNSDR
jgi:hypothetical protein